MVITRRAQDVADLYWTSIIASKRGVFTGDYTGPPLTRKICRALESENRLEVRVF